MKTQMVVYQTTCLHIPG